jgi:NAD+ kinase
MKRILVLVNADKPGTSESLQALCPWLGARARFETHEFTDAPFKVDHDLVVVLGGDGSILKAARILQGREIPVVGINMGKLGYLAEFSAEEFCQKFEAIADGRLPLSKRMMLSAWVERAGGEKSGGHLVLNDIVLTGGDFHRMVAIRTTIDGEDVTTYFGDGVLVSTPTGSTAYCMAAGGPVLAPRMEAMVIVPICPHSLTYRPLVVRPDSEIVLEPAGLQKEALCVVDGQDQVRLARGDRVRISRSDASFLLVHNPDHPPFATLREKLHWGQTPKYK